MQLHCYARRIQQSIKLISVRTPPNLNAVFLQFVQPEMLLQRFFGRRRAALKDTALSYRRFLSNSEAIQAIQQRLRDIPRNFKNDSSNLLRVWMHQCECVVAQRVRRGQQMFALYTRIWEEQALRTFAQNIRKHLQRRGRELMLSAGIAYNWDRNRISEDEMRTHMEEIEYIQLLKRKTIECTTCDKVDKNIISFCECDTRKDLKTYDGWTVFIEQQDLIVWRRPHKSGSYEYKVYGNYKDVTAEDFLSVQMDTNYRKKWDPTAVALEVVEQDKLHDSNSDIVYWEMQWPRLFANRDYVFKRRYLVDKAKKRVMLLSKGTEHPKHPNTSNKYRVVDYWSAMVVKPYTEIDKPGIEFSLTYFDNPGVNIPASVTAWVAYRAMPDFLTRLRAATIKYKQYCESNKCRGIYSYHDDKSGIKKTSNEDEPSEGLDDTHWENHWDDSFYRLLNNELDEQGAEVEQLSNQIHKHNGNDTVRSKSGTKSDSTQPEPARPVIVDGPHSSAPGAEVILTPSPIVQNEQSYWKYLQPTYYIS